MLDAFIIEELKRRQQELERQRDSERPRLEIIIPLPEHNEGDDSNPQDITPKDVYDESTVYMGKVRRAYEHPDRVYDRGVRRVRLFYTVA